MPAHIYKSVVQPLGSFPKTSASSQGGGNKLPTTSVLAIVTQTMMYLSAKITHKYNYKLNTGHAIAKMMYLYILNKNHYCQVRTLLLMCNLIVFICLLYSVHVMAAILHYCYATILAIFSCKWAFLCLYVWTSYREGCDLCSFLCQ